jgi:hypothetical protein
VIAEKLRNNLRGPEIHMKFVVTSLPRIYEQESALIHTKYGTLNSGQLICGRWNSWKFPDYICRAGNHLPRIWRGTAKIVFSLTTRRTKLKLEQQTSNSQDFCLPAEYHVSREHPLRDKPPGIFAIIRTWPREAWTEHGWRLEINYVKHDGWFRFHTQVAAAQAYGISFDSTRVQPNCSNGVITSTA